MIIPISNNINSNDMMYDNDNSSTCSSTVAVVGISKPLGAVDGVHHSSFAPPLKNKMRRRSVHFDEAANKVYENKQICKEDCKELWYDGNDYNSFKLFNKTMVKHIAQHERKNSNPHSFQRTLLRAYKACHECQFDTSSSVLTSTDEKHLRRWMELSTTLLGLERSSIRAINRDRCYRRKDLVQAVLDIQDEMEQSETLICEDARAEYLRQTCEAISRPSRIFARQLGQAQAPVADVIFFS